MYVILFVFFLLYYCRFFACFVLTFHVLVVQVCKFTFIKCV